MLGNPNPLEANGVFLSIIDTSWMRKVINMLNYLWYNTKSIFEENKLNNLRYSKESMCSIATTISFSYLTWLIYLS